MSESNVYTIRLPKRLAAEVLRRGFDVELIVVEILFEKLNLDPSKEIATRIEVAEHFFEEAGKYVEKGDAVQAGENLYKVAEECVKALAVKFKVQEVEEARREGRWWAKPLARATRTLSATLNDPMVRYTWENAYDLHVWGLHEATYNIDYVRTSIPTIEQLLVKTKELIRK